MEYNGNYATGICFPQYVFGAGTQTFFAVTTSGNGWWDNWVNWGGVWQDLVAYNLPMAPSNAAADFVPAEIIERGDQYIDPYLPSIPDQQAQIFDGTNWHWRFPSVVPTGVVQQGPYCPLFPVAYTNVTIQNSC